MSASEHSALEGRRGPAATTGRSVLALLALVLASAVGAAAASATVKSEFFRSVDIASLGTCSWADGQPAANLEVERTIRQSVEKQLRAKGFRLVGADAECRVRTRVIRDRNFPVGVLIVEIVAAEDNAVAWRGEASGLTNHPLQKIDKIIRRSIKKMFREFPRAD